MFILMDDIQMIIVQAINVNPFWFKLGIKLFLILPGWRWRQSDIYIYFFLIVCLCWDGEEEKAAQA